MSMQGDREKLTVLIIFNMENYETENIFGKEEAYCLKLRDATPFFIGFFTYWNRTKKYRINMETPENILDSIAKRATFLGLYNLFFLTEVVIFIRDGGLDSLIDKLK